jgi:transcription elongation factor Elf1
MITIQGEVTGELDVKRFYLRGLQVTFNCPACQKENQVRLDKTILNYPELGSVNRAYLDCQHCNAELTIPLYVRINVSPAGEVTIQ